MALLNRADLNVICVDWMLGASPPYSQAVANTRLVGSMIAHFIQIIQVSNFDFHSFFLNRPNSPFNLHFFVCLFVTWPEKSSEKFCQH